MSKRRVTRITMVLALDILCLSLFDFFFMLLLFFHSFVLTLSIYSVESIKKKWQKFKQFKETKHKENQLKRAKKLETTSPTENVQFKGLVSFFPFSPSLSFLLSPSSSPLLYLLWLFTYLLYSHIYHPASIPIWTRSTFSKRTQT